jgi:RNA polymerase sigma factor (sigma-70 family)
MTGARPETLLHHLRRLAAVGGPAGPSDGELLHRFAAAGDTTAFEALLRRHGPMVLGVCRRVLRHEQDAEDAFQATFLTLARRAAAVRKHESVGSFVYGVAYRQANNLRAARARRAVREARAAPPRAADPLDEITVREAQELLDAELSRLPERLRAPLVLCCLEGLARDVAARQLGLPLRTFKARLERARGLLRARLGRRGLTLLVALSTALLGESAARAGSPASLFHSTLQAAAGATRAAAAPPAPWALAGARLKISVALLLAAGIVASGAGLLAQRGGAPPGPAGAAAAPPAAASPEVRTDPRGDPLPPGALARMGTVRWRLEGPPADAMAVAPDGKTLVTVNAAKGIVVWDTATGRALRQIPEDPEQRKQWLGEPFWSVSAVSADGRKAVLVPSYNSVTYVVDVPTGKLQQSWKNTHFPMDNAVLSVDGQVLATRADTAVQVWGTASGQLLRQLAVPRKQRGGWRTRWLALSGDGKTLAWVGDDKECPVQVVNVATGDARCVLGEHDGGERQIVLSPDGRLLAELDSDNFQVRERATREIEEFGELARPAFERVLSGNPSAEVRSRIAQLAEKCAPARSPERLRALRAVEVLEQVGTAEARSVLEALAKGAPEARLTLEARASLARLDARR